MDRRIESDWTYWVEGHDPVRFRGSVRSVWPEWVGLTVGEVGDEEMKVRENCFDRSVLGRVVRLSVDRAERDRLGTVWRFRDGSGLVVGSFAFTFEKLTEDGGA